jgi:hypothetical protein
MATSTVNKTQLRKLHRQWERGQVTKADIERQLGVSGARGKYITRLWENRLGLDTRYGQSVSV